MKTSRIWIAGAGAALLAAAAAGIVACKRGGGGHDHAGHGHDEHGDEHAGEGEKGHADEVTLTPEAIQRNGIRVEKAAKVAIVPTVLAAGRVAPDPDATAHVRAPVAGRIRELRVKRGDTVKQGDVVVVLDSPALGDAQIEWLEKRAAARSSGPTVEIARSAYERGKALLEAGGNITMTEVQRREAEWKSAAAAVVAAEASVTAAGNRLRVLGMDAAAVGRLASTEQVDTTVVLTAPIAGTVVEREATPAEVVQPDGETLMVIADVSAVWVSAHVPEARLADVSIGAPVTLRVAAIPGKAIAGRVSALPPVFDEATRTASLRIEVQDAQGLRPGMYVEAEIVSGPAAAPVLVIPDEAVQTVEGAPAVFVPVPNEPNTFAKRAVRVGPRAKGLVQVLDGLAEGESYVASGSFLLKAELGKSSAAHEH